MYLDQINYIFIHIDKNGGNYLTKNFILNSLTSDRIVKKSHDDGINDFRVIGKYTEHKHQNLDKYLSKIDKKQVKIITSIRDPFERLISFYFATSNRMKTFKIVKKINHQLFKLFKTNLPFSKKFYRYEKPIFNEDEFIKFINNVPSQKEKFFYKDRYVVPDYIIKFETLKDDLRKFLKIFMNNPIIYEKKINSNKFYSSNEKIKIYENVKIKQAFLKSKHFEDYEFFGIKANKYITI